MSGQTLNASGGATPGGSDTQIQYNNAGAFGGVSNGTAGHVLTSNGAGVVPSFQASGGSGGNVTSSTAIASPPGSPASGDLDLYSDAPYVARYSGSAWIPFGPVWPLTLPSDSGFSWDNQGGATLSTANGMLVVTVPAAAGDNLRVRYKTAPSTPYTITALFIGTPRPVNFNAFGLVFRQGSDGKIVTFGVCGNTGNITGYSLSAFKYNSATSFNAVYISSTGYGFPFGGSIWLRVTDNGTNRICSVSYDGFTFEQIQSISRTDFLTADQIGFYGSAENGTYGLVTSVVSWKET